MDQQVDLAGAGGRFDAIRAVDQHSSARFQPEPVERPLAQRALNLLAEIGGNIEVLGLERAGQRRLELALGIGGIELGAIDRNPRAAAGRPGAHVRSDLAVGPERQPDQAVAGALAAGEDAGPLGDVRSGLFNQAFAGLIWGIPQLRPPLWHPAWQRRPRLRTPARMRHPRTNGRARP